jgi:hypothetical protein
MGLSCRIFLLDQNDHLLRLSNTKFEQMLRNPTSTSSVAFRRDFQCQLCTGLGRIVWHGINFAMLFECLFDMNQLKPSLAQATCVLTVDHRFKPKKSFSQKSNIC